MALRVQPPDLIELCAGTAAVSLRALGAPRFPASRIGGKNGYAPAILAALGLREGQAKRVMLVEQDVRMALVLASLFDSAKCARLADAIARVAAAPARKVWEAAKNGTSAADGLLWLAGARGGIGGFKGAHCRRPSVDGFIPSRESLAQRVRAFLSFTDRADILNRDALSIDPRSYAPTRVYIDPPYLGRQGYDHDLGEPVEVLAQRWEAAGHLVVVSEGKSLLGGKAREITTTRQGQNRRSLNTDAREWITVYGGSSSRRNAL